MSWNYRVVKHTQISLMGEIEYSHEIHEAYYNDDGSIRAISKDPIPAHGESLEDLQQDLTWMLEALSKPVLIYEDY